MSQAMMWTLKHRSSPARYDLTGHDISYLPGGYLVHHSICWCRRPR